jgi:hypothetical protein
MFNLRADQMQGTTFGYKSFSISTPKPRFQGDPHKSDSGASTPTEVRISSAYETPIHLSRVPSDIFNTSEKTAQPKLSDKNGGIRYKIFIGDGTEPAPTREESRKNANQKAAESLAKEEAHKKAALKTVHGKALWKEALK